MSKIKMIANSKTPMASVAKIAFLYFTRIFRQFSPLEVLAHFKIRECSPRLSFASSLA